MCAQFDGELVSPSARKYDPDTRLDYHGARYYDPKIGRFIQEDPIMFGGGVDFYLYTANSPVESFFTESRAFSEGRGEPWMPTKVFGMQ
ncbi:MAG TPA: RHS repeat-associated core domain-containing protein [Terriglobales bacterium]|nr:RHS repeat-associated core domain-containing protein [Terriglobales bacterium]